MSALQWIRIRDLWKLPDGRDWLWGKLSLVLRGRAMLSKSLIYFSVDGWGYVQCKSRVFVLWLFEFWNAKVGCQEIPGVTGKFGPWSTKWSRKKANRVLSREHTSHNKHLFPTTQEITLYMDITRWSIPKSGWLCSLQPMMENLFTVSKNKTWRWYWLKLWAPSCKIQA